MKAFSILIVAPILLVALLVSSVDAQAPATGSKPSATGTKSPATGTKKRTPRVTTKLRIPPPPPIPLGSKYRLSAKTLPMVGEPDPSGRKDMSGRSVPFYPNSKGLTAVQNGTSPIRVGKRIGGK
jgi:hypothetical protein